MNTAAKERPILFSGAMVRAILEGRKTQTRRIIPDRVLEKIVPEYHAAFLVDTRNACPYGSPFSRNKRRLWVRENIELDVDDGWVYSADGTPLKGDTDEAIDWLETRPALKNYYPSIHMPRWASRITLEVTEVRVQRLQEISEADALAEGVQNIIASSRVAEQDHKSRPATAIEAYRYLWDSINGEGSWAENPWVWAVSFKKVGAA